MLAEKAGVVRIARCNLTAGSVAGESAPRTARVTVKVIAIPFIQLKLRRTGGPARHGEL